MKLDAAIMDIVNKSYERAKQILSNHRSELEVLGLALIEKETLSGTEIDGILGKA
jgi:ATP-dependent Zn protease